MEWPTKYDDFFPYSSDPHWFWSGFYSSRPGFKKQVKDSSSAFHAHSKLFARRVIDSNSTDDEISTILDVHFKMLDSLGVDQHHDSITGTDKQYVNNDYSSKLQKNLELSRGAYKTEI